MNNINLWIRNEPPPRKFSENSSIFPVRVVPNKGMEQNGREKREQLRTESGQILIKLCIIFVSRGGRVSFIRYKREVLAEEKRRGKVGD